MESSRLIYHNENGRLIIFFVLLLTALLIILFMQMPVGSKLIFISAVLAYGYVMNYQLILNYSLYPSVLKATQIRNFKKVNITIPIDIITKVEIKISRGSAHFNIFYQDNNAYKKFPLSIGKYSSNKYNLLTLIEAVLKYNKPVYFSLLSTWDENKVKNDLHLKGFYLNHDRMVKCSQNKGMANDF